VAEQIAEIERIGVGGVILVLRLGPMPAEVEVAPEFRDRPR
jgi:hypothetical protein